MTSDKIVQLHDVSNGTLIETTNIYPYIKSKGCVLNDDGDTIEVQPKLVSKTNIKTVNGESLLGEGDISIKKIILDAVFPVGSIFVYAKTTIGSEHSVGEEPTECPVAGSLGGTWKRISGKFLYAAVDDSSDSIKWGDSGGYNNITIPKHTHTINSAGAHKHDTQNFTLNDTSYSNGEVFSLQQSNPVTTLTKKQMSSIIYFRVGAVNAESAQPIFGIANTSSSSTSYNKGDDIFTLTSLSGVSLPSYIDSDGKWSKLNMTGSDQRGVSQLNADFSHIHITSTDGAHTHIVDDTGTTDIKNSNFPPYEAVLMWKRKS